MKVEKKKTYQRPRRCNSHRLGQLTVVVIVVGVHRHGYQTVVVVVAHDVATITSSHGGGEGVVSCNTLSMYGGGEGLVVVINH